MDRFLNKNSLFYPLFGLCVLSVGIFSILVVNRTPTSLNWQEQWRITKPFKIARRAPAAVIANGYLYIIGGVDQFGRYVRDVEYSRIQQDGSLGPWQTTTALNEGRFYLSAIARNNYIYCIGGGSGPLGSANYPVATVERAHIKPDGSLSPWEHEHQMETARRGLKTAVSDSGRIYAIGGYNGQFLRSVEHTVIDNEGHIRTWNMDPQLSNLDRYIHSAAIYDKYLYVLGGHVQKQNKLSYGDVEMTLIKKDGYLDHWRIEKSHLQQPRFIASAFATHKHLYMAGGHNGGQRLNSVEFAPIYRSGHIGQWEYTASLNQARSATAIAINQTHVYVLGGMSNESILNSVEYTSIDSNGKLGFKLP